MLYQYHTDRRKRVLIQILTKTLRLIPPCHRVRTQDASGSAKQENKNAESHTLTAFFSQQSIYCNKTELDILHKKLTA